MGGKGESKGLKRKPAPGFWPIHRKETTWTVKPSPGPHPVGNCLPLAVVLRDILGFAKTRKEAKTIVTAGKVKVDGKTRREDTYPVGLLDVISIPEAGKSYRVLPSARGLIVQPIEEAETKFKLCRLESKKVTRNGHVQLNFHDGSSMLIKVADAKNPQEDVYETLNTLQISLPEKQLLGRIEAKEKHYAIITGGKNIGRHGRIVEIERAEGKRRRSALVTVEESKGNRYQTILDFVFALGETRPLVSLPEETQNG